MSEILPEEIQCPDCGADLKLNEKERRERKFACPVCKETFVREDQVEMAKDLLKEILIRFMGASATTENENEVDK